MADPGGQANLAFMNEESRGKLVQDRRKALGILSVREFATATGLSRNAITSAEAGSASEITYERLESWLDKFEHETGADEPEEPKTVTFKLSGNFGVDVVVEGPVSNLAELEAAVEKLLRGMREAD